MKISTGLENKKARIELIPLLDVMFLVLVFFIYSILTMTAQRSIGIDLPKAEGQERGKAVTVLIDREHRMSLGGRPLLPSEVPEAVKSALSSLPPDTPVILRADRQADLGVCLELLAALRDSGLDSIYFETEDKP